VTDRSSSIEMGMGLISDYDHYCSIVAFSRTDGNAKRSGSSFSS
jgi:hypothetical protein